MGGYHPEQLHGHLMCSSLSDHALTGDSSKDKKARQAGHTLHSLVAVSSAVRANTTVTSSSPLHSARLTLHVCPEYTFARDGALCRRLPLSLAMFARRRCQVVATHCTTWNPQSQADSPQEAPSPLPPLFSVRRITVMNRAHPCYSVSEFGLYVQCIQPAS